MISGCSTWMVHSGLRISGWAEERSVDNATPRRSAECDDMERGDDRAILARHPGAAFRLGAGVGWYANPVSGRSDLIFIEVTH